MSLTLNIESYLTGWKAGKAEIVMSTKAFAEVNKELFMNNQTDKIKYVDGNTYFNDVLVTIEEKENYDEIPNQFDYFVRNIKTKKLS